MEQSRDVICGARAITSFLNDEILAVPFSENQIFHLAEAGQIPCGRLGGKLIASKQKLREHFARLVSGGE